MKEREYLLTLYEIYKNILSDKEKSYFKDWEINIDVLRCRAAYCAIF